MKLLIKVLGIALLFSSCAITSPFTSQVQQEYKLSEKELKKVQFYTSDVIVLSKIKQKDNATVYDGKLLMSEEKNSEQIIIKKNTPCILEQIVDDNKYLFSFENGEDRILLFGNTNGGYFSLMAKEWTEGRAIIKYAGKEYSTKNGNVFLKVKIRKLKSLEKKQRVVKGRKV